MEPGKEGVNGRAALIDSDSADLIESTPRGAVAKSVELFAMGQPACCAIRSGEQWGNPHVM